MTHPTRLTTLYRTSAVMVWAALFAKSMFSVDDSFDSWWYHLPFAARLVGICSAEHYQMCDWLESCYQGFPLLVEFLQGVFWRVTGRPESANLVSCLSLLLLTVVAAKQLRVPVILPTLCFLSVPLVQIHATRCHVDLFAAVYLALFLWGAFLIILGPTSQRAFWFFLLCGVFAANSKVFAVPFVGLGLFGLLLLGFLKGWSRLVQSAGLSAPAGLLLCGALSLAPYVENLVHLGNPVYPVKVRWLGKELPGTFTQEQQPPNTTFDRLPRPMKWLVSVSEVDLLAQGRFNLKLWPYSTVMAPPDGSASRRTGGFLGPLVLLHLGLLFYLFRQQTLSLQAPPAMLYLAVVSFFCSLLPQSHELRYGLFWMLLLIMLNLTLVRELPAAERAVKWLIVTHALILAFLLVWSHFAAFRSYHWSKHPLVSFSALRHHYTDPQVAARLLDEHRIVFLQGFTPYAFLYASCFQANPKDSKTRIRALETTDSIPSSATGYILLDARASKAGGVLP